MRGSAGSVQRSLRGTKETTFAQSESVSSSHGDAALHSLNAAIHAMAQLMNRNILRVCMKIVLPKMRARRWERMLTLIASSAMFKDLERSLLFRSAASTFFTKSAFRERSRIAGTNTEVVQPSQTQMP